ncbi:MAG: 1,4-dihydroxy-2-naphthoate octaprenyltransferase, partial [Candidatus Nanopelagicales bacterium]
VRRAAFMCFGLGALCGLVLVVDTAEWWLLGVGVASVLAAWFYTGGRVPYGYYGLGEVMVFLFFGVVATTGTAYVQMLEFSWLAYLTAIGIGALACALLVVNNLRDIPTDTKVGKRTLAVRLGVGKTRVLYVSLIVVALLVAVVIAVVWSSWALLSLVAFIPALPPVGAVIQGRVGRDLIPVLVATGQAQLLYGLLLGVGLAISS